MRLRIIIFTIIILIVGFYLFHLEDSPIVLRCPVKWLTGLSCSACGVQRALHAVLHGNFKEAVGYNYFLLPGSLYAALVVISESSQDRRIKKYIINRPVGLAFMMLALMWMVVRNIYEL